ncbi:MAG: tricarballylate utilization 4Fe-4S protein TcuB [Alphaproteobacteria bacterium]|nr:tricarballylate utilization 4Fe-4S protein TcuB [Alphaproteobacteria bacterium]
MRETEAVADARRYMEICNGCRYCEGFCAVFPAMELRREFAAADLSYLANLCHNCMGCFYACQYAPPHEFGVNVPRAFSLVRAESYEQYAWPAPLARAFQRNGVVVSLVAAASIALVLILVTALQSPEALYAAHPVLPGAFYAVIPLWIMQVLGLVTFLFALLALAMGGANFWRDTGAERVGAGAVLRALWDVLSLRNLGGGGHGCNDRDERFSMTRRWLHHAMFYGFFLCFAATCTGFVYHAFLGWHAPYPLLSAPVVLGTVGGVLLIVGTVGLFAMKLIGDPAPAARRLLGADVALLMLLALTSLTGLVLLALRGTGAMGIALAVHLGFILALFLLLPYSKMVHGVYRSLALLRNAAERRGVPENP